MTTVLDAALAYLSSGLTCIPIKLDGTKAPLEGSEWRSMIKKSPTEKKIRGLFSVPSGLAVLGGKTSGGLEIIDFDRGDAFAPWADLVEHIAPGLLAVLPIVKTPLGYHVYFRSEQCGKNQKLAMGKDPTPGKNSTCIIETRGEGGYVIAPPSPAEVHPSGIAYVMHQGALNSIPTISSSDRDCLIDAARSFNEVVQEEKTPLVSTPGGKGRPGDAFNERATWEEILLPYGWRIVRQFGQVTHWQRPGKDDRGISATTGFTGDKLYVFSSNAIPFDAGRAYSKFTAYGRLAHGGDFKAASRALKEKGFGEQHASAPRDSQWSSLTEDAPPIGDDDAPPMQTPTQTTETPRGMLSDELEPLLDDDKAAALVEPNFSRLLASRSNVAEWQRITALLTRHKVIKLFLDQVKKHDRTKRKKNADDWKEQLQYKENRDGESVLENILSNHLLILRNDPAWLGVLAFDEFANQVVCRRKPPIELHRKDRWSDVDVLRLKSWFETHYEIRPNTIATSEALELAAKADSFNALTAYLDGLESTDKSVLDTWLIDYFGAPDTPYVRTVGAKWMISAVARAYIPGCKVDTVLILEGAQGLKKSRAIEQLCPELSWFADGLSEFGTKAQAEELEGKWIIELGELKGFGKELDQIKAFVTRRAENYRPAYARMSMHSPRKCVFAGTVNPNGAGYLRDETGNRRFWPIECRKRAPEVTKELRDALWAEARDRFLLGESWWLDGEIENLAKAEQEKRVYIDPWHELVERFILSQDTVSTDDILERLTVDVSRRDTSAQMRIGRIMAALKWERYQHRWEDGRRTWRYRRMDSAALQMGLGLPESEHYA